MVDRVGDDQDLFAASQWDRFPFGYGFRDMDRGRGYCKPTGRYPTRQDWLDLGDDSDEDLNWDERYAKIAREGLYYRPDKPDWCYWEYLRK